MLFAPRSGSFVACAVALFLCATASLQAQQLPLELAASFSAGTTPSNVRAGDLNGDGKDDLVICEQSLNDVLVYMNDGAGNFSLAQTLTGGLGPTQATIRDLDNDGDADIAVSFYTSGRIGVYRQSAGSFGAVTLFFVAAGPINIESGDFDADGDVDLVSVNFLGNCISVIFNLTVLPAPQTPNPGAFGPNFDYFSSLGPTGIAVADFDNDGDQDIALTQPPVGFIIIFANTGIGTFAFNAFFSVGAGCTGIAAGDFDQDGDKDLAVTFPGLNGLKIIDKGVGPSAWTPQPLITVGLGPTAIVRNDFDQDGKDDLAVANAADTGVSVLLGAGAHAFGVSAIQQTAGAPVAIGVGDPDGDGDKDIVTVNANATASILYHTLLGKYGAGNVGDGLGGPYDLLSVNGSFGGRDRKVSVGTGVPFHFGMAQPPTNPNPADYVIFGQIGVPNPAFDETVLPYSVGTTVLRPFVLFPTAPDLFLLVNTFPGTPYAPLLFATPTPWTSANFALGFPFTVTLQGVILETPISVRVTNAVVLDIF